MTPSVAIIGATGFSGQELQKILERHPEVELRYAVGRNWEAVGDVDLVFLALPHGAAVEIAPQFLARGSRVIDLSADFRHPTSELIQKVQQTAKDFTADQLAYSLPELHRTKLDYSKIRLLANPGCYPTAALLALGPLFMPLHHPGRTHRFAPTISINTPTHPHTHTSTIPRTVIIDAKSGYSGAGKSFVESESFPKLQDNLWAYKIAGTHNHNKEIEDQLGGMPVSFTPHILPFYRGILETIYVGSLGVGMPVSSHQSLVTYQEFYKNEPFVKIVEELPTIKDVVNTNECHLALRYDAHVERLIIVSVIDNLVKGAAGQAVQNMNLMMGWEEGTGLNF